MSDQLDPEVTEENTVPDVQQNATQAPEPSVPAPSMPAPAPSAPAPAPVSNDTDPNTIKVQGFRPPPENALQKTAENLAFADDLQQGKIHPKTYNDLFNSSSTLGKVGTLFGLLVSGAGSGLAHQSNAVLDMMNKEIERDLDAQKTNQTNKQNWYKAAMEHEKNLTEMDQMAAITEATRMGTYGKGLENDFTKFRNQATPGLVDMTASTNSLNNMLSASVQAQQDRVNRMAPGPSKMAAQAAIDNILKPKMIQQIAKNQDQLAQKKAVINAINPNPLDKVLNTNTDPRGPVINDKLFQAHLNLGRLAPNIPGAIPPEQVAPINEEVKKIQLNRNGYADWLDSFKKLDELKNAGQLPAANVASSLMTGAGAGIGSSFGPIGTAVGAAIGNAASHSANELKNVWERERNIEAEGLKQRIGKDMSESEKNSLVNSLLPSWSDSDESRAEAYRKGMQHFKSLESTPTMDQYNLKIPFPEVPYVPFKKKEENEIKESVSRRSSNSSSGRDESTSVRSK